MRASNSTIKIAPFVIVAGYFLIHQNTTSSVAATGQEHAAGASLLCFADSILSEREYYSKLQAADEETFKQDFELYFLLLLEAEQKKEYDSFQSLDEKKAYIQHYWKASNPNPLFPQNDWLLEFNRRVQYAKRNFHSPSAPCVDDRGTYYIKYGEPHRRFVDRGGLVTYDDDFRIRYSTHPNETWSYENLQRNFVVYFVRDRASYRQARSIYEAVRDSDRHAMRNATGNTDPNMEYFIWRDMIEKRQHLSAALARAVLPIPAFRAESLQSALRERAEKLVFHIEVARNKAPAAASAPVQAKNELEFFDRVAQFRGPMGKTRIEVALLAPLKKNLTKEVEKTSDDTLKVEVSGMLRDVNFEPLITGQSSSPLVVKLAAREMLPNAVGNISLLAKPQDAELTLQVKETQREKTGYHRRPFQIRDFSSNNELRLSDIQLNYRIKNDAQKMILPMLEQENFAMCPYPYKEISRMKPPLVYFEIYNIQSAGVGESMRISYTITPIQKNKASVDVSYTRPVLGDNMNELVEVDLENVELGWNLLTVSVSSLQDSTIKAVSQKKLSVRESCKE